MSKYSDSAQTQTGDMCSPPQADLKRLQFNSRVAAEQARQEALLPRGQHLSMGDRMMIAAAMAKADSEGRTLEAPDLPVASNGRANGSAPVPIVSVVAVMTPFARAKSLKDVASAADHLLLAVHNQVPPETYARIYNICESVKTGLSLHEDNQIEASIADHDIFRLQQSILGYIPTVVDAYLAVPRLYADRPVAGKKSALEYLTEQIETIDGACQSIVEQMIAAKNSNLEGNGRFLRDIFGSNSAQTQSNPSGLDLPGAPKAG